MPASIAKLLCESVLEFLELEREEQSTGGVLLAAIQRIEDTINRGSTGLNTSQITTGNASTSFLHRSNGGVPVSYASKLAAAPPAGSSTQGPRNTKISSSIEAREIRIRVNDKEAVKKLEAYQKTSLHIVNTVNEAITNSGVAKSGNHNNGARTTVSDWIHSARILSSKDILLLAKDAPTAERLVYRRQDWQTVFGPKAKVLVPTFGVVVSNIPLQSIDLADPQATINRLRIENPHIANAHIDKVRWLNKTKPDKLVNALVVEFAHPYEANSCLRAERLAWEGHPKKLQRFSRDCQVCQCFRCHHYGHTSKSCHSAEVCGYCGSKEHKSSAHPDKKDKNTHKCVLCGSKHPAWSSDCKHRKAENKKVEAAKTQLLREPFFPEPAMVTPGASERGSVIGGEIAKQGEGERPLTLEAATVPEMEMTDGFPTPAEASRIQTQGTPLAAQSQTQPVPTTPTRPPPMLSNPLLSVTHNQYNQLNASSPLKAPEQDEFIVVQPRGRGRGKTPKASTTVQVTGGKAYTASRVNTKIRWEPFNTNQRGIKRKVPEPSFKDITVDPNTPDIAKESPIGLTKTRRRILRRETTVDSPPGSIPGRVTDSSDTSAPLETDSSMSDSSASQQGNPDVLPAGLAASNHRPSTRSQSGTQSSTIISQ